MAISMKNAFLLFQIWAAFADTLTDPNLNVTMEQKEVFLRSNTQLVCVVQYQDKYFKGEFLWLKNGSAFEIKSPDGEGPYFVGQISSTTERKVTYTIPVTEAGTYTCMVTDNGQQFNTTARVVDFQEITDYQSVDVTDQKIMLTCPEGPNGTSAFMTVIDQERPVDTRFKATADSVILKDPELSDAEKDYMCEYVFTDDIAVYRGREHIPQNRIVSAKLPVIFYEPIRDTVSTDKVNYSLKIQPPGRDIWVQICWTNNGSVEASCDNTTVMLDTSVLHVNFTIYKGVKLLLTEPFKGRAVGLSFDSNKNSRQQDPESQEQEGGGTTCGGGCIGAIVGAVVALIVGIIVIVYCCHKRRQNQETANTTAQPMVPVPQNGNNQEPGEEARMLGNSIPNDANAA